MPKLDAHDIIRTIAESKKKTPVKVYVKGDLASLEVPEELDAYFGDKAGVLFGDWKDAEKFLKDHSEITGYHVENDGRNTGVPLLDKKKFNARIEPGAIIRDQVEIGDNAVVMMGAVINIGAEIGPGSMIDMGAVLGGRAIVGANCHIGAGTVLAGVVEPPSAQPVVIEDDVLIGANAVVLEGVRVGKGRKSRTFPKLKKTRSNLSMICASSDIFEMRPLQWGFFRYLYGKGDEDGTFRKRIN